LIVNTIAILNQYGGTLVSDIKKSIAPHNATGKTSASLNFTVKREGTKEILTVTGRAFIMSLETGRKPTPQYTKPSKDFVQNIREWLAAKGEDTSPAYAIAKSIHKKGSKGTPAIITGPVDGIVDQIQKDIADQFAKQYLFNVVEFSRGNSN
jgi:hypothetical protein